MNERIQELAERAGAIEAKTITNIPRALSLNGEEIQEFAELIVRECINKIETYQISVGNSPAGEMACDWTYDALKEIRDDIKETFGLK